MNNTPNIELSPAEVRGAVDETFAVTDQYVRNHQDNIVLKAVYDPTKGADTILERYVDAPNYEDELTRIYLSFKEYRESCTTQYHVHELYIASRGLYRGFDTRFDYTEEKEQIGFGLVRYRDGFGLKQYFSVPDSYNPGYGYNTTDYIGSERRLRIMEKTGNVIFHQGADNAYNIRSMNILSVMRDRIARAVEFEEQG